jgi:hypothetical protein
MSYARAPAAELFSTRVATNFSFLDPGRRLLLVFYFAAALPGLSTPVDNFVCNYLVISFQGFKALV